jgi:Flp pilus assembly protein TadB
MRTKIANVLFVLAVVLVGIGAMFNYYQSKTSVETSLEKARRIKKEKAKQRKEEAEEIIDEQPLEVDEIETEFETIINNNNNGK